METKVLSPLQLEQLRRLSTCLVASAVETFGVRLRNTGFADSTIRSTFGIVPPMAGYAATARIRSADPPMEGRGYNYYDRNDWWNHILTIPKPCVVVIEDLDDPPGVGAFVGEVHANILLSLGCIGLVTNGSVRDLPEVRASGFQMFAGAVAVSHAYAHVFDFGGTVDVGGLKIEPGDLIHADVHGVQTVPLDVAAQVPAVAARIVKVRNRITGLCHSSKFSLETLQQAIKEATEEFHS